MADGSSAQRSRKGVRRPAEPTTPDAVEIAMEAEASGVAPDSVARTLLHKHARLIDEQMKHLRLQALNERAAAGLRLLTAVAGIAVAAVLGTMAWTAAHRPTVVVDAFSVPPDLRDRGITGQVAAQRLLDHVKTIYAGSDDTRPRESFGSDWSGTATVTLPGAGVSVEQLMSLMRRFFGTETHYSGEIVRTPKGYLVTARGDNVLASTVEGPTDQLDQTLHRTAEAVFAQAQPYRYASYLVRTARQPESIPILEKLAASGPKIERPWAWSLLAVVYSLEGDQRKSLVAARAAVTEDPNFVLGHAYLANTSYFLGLTGSELAGYRAALPVRRSAGMTKEAAERRRQGVLQSIASLTGDYETSVTAEKSILARSTTRLGRNATEAALEAIRWHDLPQARQLALASPAKTDLQRLEYARSGAVYPIEYEMRAEVEDWLGARSVAAETLAGSPAGAFWDAVRDVHLRPRLAVAAAHTGDFATAEAELARTALDCYPCLIARGQVAELAGQHAAADRWFGEAVRQAPAIPFAYGAWAQAKLDRGDPAGAEPMIRSARRTGPRWADALKLEGDAHLGRGNVQAAVRSYKAAVKRAPQWGKLRVALAKAQLRSGRRDEADTEMRTAAGMDLSPNDRSELGRLLAGRAEVSRPENGS